MTNTPVKILKSFSTIVAMTVGLGAIFASTPAFAATCVPGNVEYLPGQLLIQCPGSPAINYYAQTSPPNGCSAYTRTLDTIKIWLSIAQAALLASKNVNIYTTSCGSFNMITAVDILR